MRKYKKNQTGRSRIHVKLMITILVCFVLLSGCGGQKAGNPGASSIDGDGGETLLQEHSPAAEPQEIDNPIEGYCGNIVTKVMAVSDSGAEVYSFWGGGSVSLTALLQRLDYSEESCRCMPEYIVTTEIDKEYGVNLSQYYVRIGDKQVSLTEEQVQVIRDVIKEYCVPENLEAMTRK